MPQTGPLGRAGTVRTYDERAFHQTARQRMADDASSIAISPLCGMLLTVSPTCSMPDRLAKAVRPLIPHTAHHNERIDRLQPCAATSACSRLGIRVQTSASKKPACNSVSLGKIHLWTELVRPNRAKPKSRRIEPNQPAVSPQWNRRIAPTSGLFPPVPQSG
jgi:hypothetical protein